MPSARPLGPVLLTLALAMLSPGPGRAQPAPPPPKYPSEVGGKNLDRWLDDFKHADASVREEAIGAIICFGPVTGKYLDALLERTVDRDAGPRCSAVMALGICELNKADHSRIVDALAKRLNSDKESKGYEPQGVIRLQAALTLCRFGEDARPAIPALVLGTDYSSWHIRRASVRALAGAGYAKGGPDVRAFQAVSYALKDESAGVRMEAIIGLGYLGKCTADPIHQRAAENYLLNIARNPSDRDPNARVLAIWATVSLMMIEQPDDRLIAMVGSYVQSPEPHIRMNAIRAVGVMGTRAKQFVPNLIKALDDKEPAIVFQAILSLASMGKEGTPAVAALKELSERKDKEEVKDPILENRNERLRQAAKYAIEQITKPAPAK